MNRLGHGSTSAITHITPESQPQLQCQTAHCSLALKHLGSFRNEELHARKRHLENREELSIHLARFYPSPILSPNLRAGGNRRLGLTSQLGSLSLEEWIRLQKRLGESRSGAPTCPSALLEGWHWYGRKFKCGPGTWQRLPWWSLHILISCSQPLAPEDACWFEKRSQV